MFKTECRHLSTVQQKTQTKITFATAQPLDELEVLQLDKAIGYLVFSPDPLKKGVEEAVKDIKLAVEPGKQSPSKLLRGALYEYWFKHQQGKTQWEDYYQAKMNGLIKMIKEKL